MSRRSVVRSPVAKPEASGSAKRSLPWGASLYVRGLATDSAGSLQMQKPEDGVFTVSVKSREATVDAAAKSARNLRIAAAVLLVAGAALILAGLLT